MERVGHLTLKGTACGGGSELATMTITTTGAQDTRIVVAFGHYLGLPRDATAAEVKANVIDYIRNVVRNDGDRLAIANRSLPAPLDPT